MKSPIDQPFAPNEPCARSVGQSLPFDEAIFFAEVLGLLPSVVARCGQPKVQYHDFSCFEQRCPSFSCFLLSSVDKVILGGAQHRSTIGQPSVCSFTVMDTVPTFISNSASGFKTIDSSSLV